LIRSVKGTHDILPDESHRWHKIESVLHSFMQQYGYNEIRTPAFEKTELFARGIGTETDIVTKEMYSWIDQGGEKLTLKPELTAPVVRAYIQHNLASNSAVNRLYYLDALFRRERPQKGRTRQFHQFGAEVFGSEHPEADVEIITLVYNFYKSLGFKKITLRLNSVGSVECREKYRKELYSFLKPFLTDLSETSKLRFQKNPLRILDTKIENEKEIIKNAPKINNFFTKDDVSHFESVKSILRELEIPFTIDPQMVRGLDYYSRTTFEITSKELGAQDALCGGGRYDNLVEMLGGKPTPAVGFAAGMERLLIALKTKLSKSTPEPVQIYIVGLIPSAQAQVQKIASELRVNGWSVITDLLRRSLKAALRDANRKNAKISIIIGEEELAKNGILVKIMKSGEQTKILRKNFINHLTSLDL